MPISTCGVRRGRHLFELYNMWVYEPLMIEDFSFHIFRNLCKHNQSMSHYTGAPRDIHEAPLDFWPTH